MDKLDEIINDVIKKSFDDNIKRTLITNIQNEVIKVENTLTRRTITYNDLEGLNQWINIYLGLYNREEDYSPVQDYIHKLKYFAEIIRRNGN